MSKSRLLTVACFCNNVRAFPLWRRHICCRSCECAGRNRHCHLVHAASPFANRVAPPLVESLTTHPNQKITLLICYFLPIERFAVEDATMQLNVDCGQQLVTGQVANTRWLALTSAAPFNASPASPLATNPVYLECNVAQLMGRFSALCHLCKFSPALAT